MRLPGFLNTKREPFVPCRILGENHATCKLDDITAVLDSLDTQQSTPKIKPQSAKAMPNAKDYAERRARAVLYASKVPGVSEGQRNSEAYKLAAAIREKFGLQNEDLMEILSGWNSKNTPPLDSGELASIINHVGNYAKKAGAGYEPLKNTSQNTVSEPRLKTKTCSEILPQEIDFLIRVPRPMICLNSVMELILESRTMSLQVWASTPVVISLEVVAMTG